MKLYELKEVRKVYHRFCALDVPYLSIERGEIISIFGPNGAGKSTLMRLLAFLDDEFEGEITFFNSDGSGCSSNDGRYTVQASRSHVTKSSARRRRNLRGKITLVMQEPYLFDRDVLDNIKIGLLLQSRKNSCDAAEKLAEDLKLWNLRKKMADELSAGERMKVAIARAAAINPEVLLLDEPTSSLDRVNSALIEKLIRRENSSGKTVIITTHDLQEAKRFSKDVLFLQAGRFLNEHILQYRISQSYEMEVRKSRVASYSVDLTES